MVGNAEPAKEYNYRPLSKLFECQLDVNDQVLTKGLGREQEERERKAGPKWGMEGRKRNIEKRGGRRERQRERRERIEEGGETDTDITQLPLLLVT